MSYQDQAAALKKLPAAQRRVKECELRLSGCQVTIVDLASQFLNYLALVEHPMNKLSEMEERIREQNIQVGVVNMIKDKVQPAFTEMDKSFQALATHVAPLDSTK